MHRWAGLSTAAFLTVAGVTGSVITFADELDHWLNPGLFTVSPQPQAMLSLEALSDKVREQHPGVVVRRIFPAEAPDRSTRISVLSARGPQPAALALNASEIYLNPYDGRLLGTQQWRDWRWDRSNVIPFIFRLHYTLHLPGKVGFWLMGGIAIVWLLDCIVGFYLTLPVNSRPSANRRGFWKRWSIAWKIKRDSSRYRWNLDLHRASGLWLWIFLFFLALSGAVLNLRNEVAVPLLRKISTVSPPPATKLARMQPAARRHVLYDDAAAIARASLSPTQQLYSLRSVAYLPEKNVYQVVMQEPGWQRTAFRLRDAQRFVDAQRGSVVLEASYETGTVADQFLALQYPIHSGAILGMTGRVLVCISGIAVALLSITGVVIWRRKTGAKSRNSRHEPSRKRPKTPRIDASTTTST